MKSFLTTKLNVLPTEAKCSRFTPWGRALNFGILSGNWTLPSSTSITRSKPSKVQTNKSLLSSMDFHQWRIKWHFLPQEQRRISRTHISRVCLMFELGEDLSLLVLEDGWFGRRLRALRRRQHLFRHGLLRLAERQASGKSAALICKQFQKSSANFIPTRSPFLTLFLVSCSVPLENPNNLLFGQFPHLESFNQMSLCRSFGIRSNKCKEVDTVFLPQNISC